MEQMKAFIGSFKKYFSWASIWHPRRGLAAQRTYPYLLSWSIATAVRGAVVYIHRAEMSGSSGNTVQEISMERDLRGAHGAQVLEMPKYYHIGFFNLTTSAKLAVHALPCERGSTTQQTFVYLSCSLFHYHAAVSEERS